MSTKKNKEYYAVAKSPYIDRPTIYSSWGDAHPRVTACHAEHKAFVLLDEAKAYMHSKNIHKYKIIEDGVGSTTPLWGQWSFYAVANGRSPKIYEYFNGPGGCQEAVEGISNICHKRFRERSQAEAFIEDWKAASADVRRRGLELAKKTWSMNIEGTNTIILSEESDASDESTVHGIEASLDDLRLNDCN